MRRLLILGAVLVVMAGAVFLAAANANRYLESHRDWLAEQASTALGRPVAFDAIGVSFRRGLGVRVSDVVIGEDSAFGKEAFLRATRIDAAIKILPALRGHYELARIEIDAPQINLIKSKGGFNFASIGGAKGEPPPKAEAEPSPSRALPLLVSSLRIRDGRVQFVDRTASPASTLRVDQIDVSASDIGLDRPVSLEIAAAVLDAAGQNVRIAGSVGPAQSPEAFASAPVDLRIDLGPLVVDRLKAVRPDRQVDPGRSLVSGSGFARRAALRNARCARNPRDDGRQRRRHRLRQSLHQAQRRALEARGRREASRRRRRRGEARARPRASAPDRKGPDRSDGGRADRSRSLGKRSPARGLGPPDPCRRCSRDHGRARPPGQGDGFGGKRRDAEAAGKRRLEEREPEATRGKHADRGSDDDGGAQGRPGGDSGHGFQAQWKSGSGGRHHQEPEGSRHGFQSHVTRVGARRRGRRWRRHEAARAARGGRGARQFPLGEQRPTARRERSDPRAAACGMSTTGRSTARRRCASTS